MRQQVLVIHGGDTFATYEEYLQDLQQKEIDLARLGFKDWKSVLGENLGNGYQALAPRMPNAQNAKYAEWKIVFTKIAALLQPKIILIGHSLGGIFLTKYLAEEFFPTSIRATFLIAAPHSASPPDSLADFILPGKLQKFSQQSSRVFLYHSQDDPVVPFSDLVQYQQLLPRALTRTFTDRGHFNQAELPELVADIRGLS